MTKTYGESYPTRASIEGENALWLARRLEQTPYGFRWDDVEVERSASLLLRGDRPYHSLTIKTPRRWFQVDLTPTGLLSGFREFEAPKAAK